MFSSSVPLIFLHFPGPLQRENKEKHFLIKVHWIKKQKKNRTSQRYHLQPLRGLENNLNHHFKWAVCDCEMRERHFNLAVSLASVKVEMKQTVQCRCVCTYFTVCVFLCESVVSVNVCFGFHVWTSNQQLNISCFHVLVYIAFTGLWHN